MTLSLLELFITTKNMVRTKSVSANSSSGSDCSLGPQNSCPINIMEEIQLETELIIQFKSCV